MQKAIISDTSCLILLEKIDELSVLHALFGNIITTHDVAFEFGNRLPDWVEIVDPVNKNYQEIIEATLDKGEASAIPLAIEYEDCLLIIDDLKARRFALQLGLNITGTLGILIEAKLAGHMLSLSQYYKKLNKQISGCLKNLRP